MIYGLAAKGIALLKETEDSPPFDLHLYATGGNAIHRLFLEHTLQLADILVQLQLACRRCPSVRLLTGKELHAKTPRRFSWHVQVGQKSRLGITPDAVFAIEKAGAERLIYFLESDCGTMPVERPSLERSSITRKFLGYHATWQQNIHRNRFGWDRFRVLTITTNADRVQHMISAAEKLPNGRGLFLFHDVQSVVAAADFLSLPLRSASGTNTTLLE